MSIPKPTPDEISKWEEILEKCGLGMDKGAAEEIVYVGSSSDLEEFLYHSDEEERKDSDEA
jgi:midasin (ATPase involved in ribosome maturation)